LAGLVTGLSNTTPYGFQTSISGLSKWSQRPPGEAERLKIMSKCCWREGKQEYSRYQDVSSREKGRKKEGPSYTVCIPPGPVKLLLKALS
jgi:hypothetical protein